MERAGRALSSPRARSAASMASVDEYLAELRGHLRVGPITKRRILREIAAHLTDAAREHGEEQAIERFGPPEVIASRFAPKPPEPRRLAQVGGLIVVGLG